jgi:hypothetical protein
VGGHAGPRRVTSSTRYEQTAYDFKSFRLIVVHTFLDVPSSWRGQPLHVTTTTPQAPIPPKLLSPMDGMTAKEARAFALVHFSALQEIAFSFIPETFPQQLLRIVQKVGFGHWTDNDLRKKRRRAASRSRAIFPRH